MGGRGGRKGRESRMHCLNAPSTITDRQAECACLESIQVLLSRLEASGIARVDIQCWVCLQTYAGSKGLKIHLAKSSCGREVEVLLDRIERHSA